MARKFFVGGNWKCNGTTEEVKKIVNALNEGQVPPSDVVDVVVSPPFIFLPLVKSLLRPDFHVAAQNCWVKKGGAFTGEVSAEMLVDLGIPWVILGHSERRALLNESNEFVGEKVAYALSKGLKVIACVGETLEQRESGSTMEVVAAQTKAIADSFIRFCEEKLDVCPLSSTSVLQHNTCQIDYVPHEEDYDLGGGNTLKASKYRIDTSLSADYDFMLVDDVEKDSAALTENENKFKRLRKGYLGGRIVKASTYQLDANLSADYHIFLIDNMETDLVPSTVVNFIHKHTSIYVKAYIFPSIPSELFTRGAIVVDSAQSIETLHDFLINNSERVSDWSNIVVAYEPVWAIGTGKVATPAQAQEIHYELRNWLHGNTSPEVAATTRIIYGGSVSGANCKELAAQPDVDGFLVGGASLKPEFINIINAATVKSA